MTESEMKKMQQEAVRRAEEMQNRARTVQQQSQPSHHQSEPVAEINTPNVENIQKPPERQNETGGLFETLMKDKERTLILGLILLLMDEKTDNSLIIALMYLLI